MHIHGCIDKWIDRQIIHLAEVCKPPEEKPWDILGWTATWRHAKFVYHPEEDRLSDQSYNRPEEDRF